MGNLNLYQISGMLMGGIITISAMSYIVSLVMSILTIIGGWKMFRKFGEPGWKAIIPFYSTWVEYKYTWKAVMAIPVIVLGFGGGILMKIAEAGSALQIIASLLFLAGWALTIIAYYKRSKAFGHGIGFTIGHLIAPGVMTIILGFGKSQYIGRGISNAQTTVSTAELENK